MIFAALIVWVGVLWSLTLFLLLRPAPRIAPRSETAAAQDVLVVRPCAGAERGLLRALMSSEQCGAARLRFAVASKDDAAFATCTDAAEKLVLAGRDAAVVVTGATGPNRKADQIARALRGESSADVVAVVDSDVLLSEESFSALLGGLDDRGVGLVWSIFRERPGGSLGDRASAAILGASLQSFVHLALLDRGCTVGKVFAIRQSALDAAGGFGPLCDRLGEDMELGRRVRDSGYRVAVCDAHALSLARGRSIESVVMRYARWTSVIRAQRPALLLSYPLVLASAPLQVVCAATLLDPKRGALLSVLVVVWRSTIALLATVRLGERIRPSMLFEMWLADLVLLVAFVRAVLVRDVVWRGRRLALDRSGRIRGSR